MNKKIDIFFDILKENFSFNHSFTLKEIYNLMEKKGAELNKSTIRWRIYKLLKLGKLNKIGRGIYSFSLKKRREFAIIPSSHEKCISETIKKEYPFLLFSIWRLSVLNEYMIHVVDLNFYILEVEKDGVDAVFEYLKRKNKNVFKQPSIDVVKNYVFDANDSILIKNLITESPIYEVEGIMVPRIEKILVDIISDKIFFFLEEEIVNIYKKVFDNFFINMNTLFRYARRRDKGEEINNILKQIRQNDF